MTDELPSAVVIDLSRLPAQGGEVGAALRAGQLTRRLPLVFVDGLPEKVLPVRQMLPDAVYSTWTHIGEDLQAHGADWITFTSGSIVEHFHRRFNLPAVLQKFPQTKVASMGPETTKSLEVLGMKPTIEAKEHTVEGLVAAVLKAAGRK